MLNHYVMAGARTPLAIKKHADVVLGVIVTSNGL